MRCIVMSDSHGHDGNLRWMLQLCWKTIGPVDCYIHCGDGAYDFRRLENFIRARDEHAALYSVRGNNDFGIPDLQEKQVLSLGGARVLLTHGHRYHVKSTLTYLDDAARENGCGLVLFGHTHLPMMEMCRALLVNPGSAADGRMALVEINEGKPRVNLLSY